MRMPTTRQGDRSMSPERLPPVIGSTDRLSDAVSAIERFLSMNKGRVAVWIDGNRIRAKLEGARGCDRCDAIMSRVGSYNLWATREMIEGDLRAAIAECARIAA